MPPKPAQPTQSAQPPQTPNQRTAALYHAGIPSTRTLQTAISIARNPSALEKFSAKGQKQIWKTINDAKEPVPYRVISSERHDWGKDKAGQAIGEYTLERFDQRQHDLIRLSGLLARSRAFGKRRERARAGWTEVEAESDSTERVVIDITKKQVDEEKTRRVQIARLRMELYGEKTGPYALNPEWDDVVPMPMEEGEGSLAAIAYPENYADAVSYLRAVMAANEHSVRCLRLTEDIISINPAHYTVWLYRFAIIQALNIPLAEERRWLNQVSLDHLKNYQIWHHRRLLMDHYYPDIKKVLAADREKLIRDEQDFMAQMLAEDTKNYHVWSYRQYLVPKLQIFSDPEEIKCIERFISDDVRNNSAWSHRFFVVFSNPEYATQDSLATQHDPKIPQAVLDRELEYAKEKILLAPQNQSPWNYLKGVLVKGGRPLASVESFVLQFVKNLGDEDKEAVKSTHALDFLAEIRKEKGETKEAALCLERLGDKWDPIRKGYWDYRRQVLEEPAAAVA